MPIARRQVERTTPGIRYVAALLVGVLLLFTLGGGLILLFQLPEPHAASLLVFLGGNAAGVVAAFLLAAAERSQARTLWGMRTVSACALDLARARSSVEMAEVAVSYIEHVLPKWSAVIFRIDPRREPGVLAPQDSPDAIRKQARELLGRLQGDAEELRAGGVTRLGPALVIPLRDRRNTRGAAVVTPRDADQTMDQDDEDTVAAICAQLAGHLSGALLIEAQADWLDVEQTLDDLRERISGSFDLGRIASRAVSGLQRALGADLVHTCSPCGDGRQSCLAAAPEDAPAPEALGDALCRWMGDRGGGRAVAIGDLRSDERAPSDVREAAEALGLGACLGCAPDAQEEGPALCAWFREPREFTTRDTVIAERVAYDLRVAWRQASAYASARRQAELLDAIKRATQLLTATFDVDRIARSLADGIADTLPGSTVSVLIRGDGGEMEPRAVGGPGASPTPESALVAQACEGGATVVLPGQGEGAHGPWLVPSVTEGEVVGAIVASLPAPPERDTLAFLEDLALQLAIAVRNARLVASQRTAYSNLQVTQTKLIEMARLEAFGTLAAGVAHDFNNILAPISAHVDLMLGETEGDIKRRLMLIRQVARDGAGIVDRIQAYAGLREPQEPGPVNARELLLAARDITLPKWKSEAESRGIAYAVEVRCPEEPIWVRGVGPELREILVNLLINAIEALPQGGRIVLSCARDEAADVGVLTVADNGPGVPEDMVESIFHPFVTTKGPSSSGLGLSVVIGLIERQAAAIEVGRSAEGGAEFRIRIPLSSAPAAEEVEPGRYAAASRPLRILVVDDEEPVLSVVVEALELFGHHPVGVGGALEALAEIERRQPGAAPFQAVVTDLGMPGMSGWALAERIGEVAPDVPVIVMTGWGQAAKPDTDVTVRRVIGKPIDLTELREALDELAHARPSE